MVFGAGVVDPGGRLCRQGNPRTCVELMEECLSDCPITLDEVKTADRWNGGGPVARGVNGVGSGSVIESGDREAERKAGSESRRILVVDDDPYALRAIGWALSCRGYSVSVATDKGAAASLMELRRYDLMIAAEQTGADSGRDTLGGAAGRQAEGKLFSIYRSMPAPGFCGFVRLSQEDCLFSLDGLSEFLATVDACLRSGFGEDADTLTSSQARSLNEEMLRLLMVMSHDTRGTLIAIGAGLKMLSRGLFGRMEESASVKASELYARVQDLVLMAEEFLAEAFVLRDGSRMALDRLDLRTEVIMPVLEELGVDLQDHSARFVGGPSDGEPGERLFVTGNKTCLKAVLRNLVRNAIDHGEQGCVVNVGIEEDGSYYRLYVRNTGTSISPEFRDALFTPVRNVAREKRGSSHGTGFGLYLIREIVKHHGGRIWYEPLEDGSRFLFTLPRAEDLSKLINDQSHEIFSRAVAFEGGLSSHGDATPYGQ